MKSSPKETHSTVVPGNDRMKTESDQEENRDPVLCNNPLRMTQKRAAGT